MPTAEKKQYVADLKEKLQNIDGLYLCTFDGISAEDMNQLRGMVLDAGGRIQIIKNRLFKIAITDTPAQQLEDHLSGPVAVTWYDEDPVSPAKAMKEFSKELERDTQLWEIKAAWIDGQILQAEQARAMADMPTVDELRASVVGTIAAPLHDLVGTLNAAVADLVFTLQAVAQEREQQAG